MIPMNKPWFGREEADAILGAVKLDDYSAQSAIIEKFEIAFAKATGAKFAVAVNSEAVARALAVMATVDLQPAGMNGEIWASPLTAFSAYDEALWLSRFRLNFCDLENRSFIIDFPSLKQKIDFAKTNLIFISHSLGWPVNLEQPFQRFLEPILGQKIFIIEDCSEALGASISFLFNRKVQVGTMGNFGYFSFGHDGIINARDAACLITDNETDFERLKTFGAYVHMNVIQAALGLVQLAKLPIVLAMRQTIAKAYAEQIKLSFKSFSFTKGANIVNCCFPILVENRDALLKKFHENGIGAEILKRPSITSTPYFAWPEEGVRMKMLKIEQNDMFSTLYSALPNFKFMMEHVVKLPCFPGLTERDVTKISHIVNMEAQPCE